MTRRLIICTLAVLLLRLESARAQAVSGSVIRVTPTTLPGTCNTGDMRNDVNDSNRVKVCRTNVWSTIESIDLGNGTAGQVLQLSTTSATTWGFVQNANVSSTAGITYGKLNLTASITNADVATNAGIVDTKLGTLSTAGKVLDSATTATPTNLGNTIVERDVSGNFTASTIFATLFNGTASVAGTASFASTASTSGTAFFSATSGTASFSTTASTSGTAASANAFSGTNLTVPGTLNVTGASTQLGAMILGSTLSVTSSITGLSNVTVAGTLNVTGASTFAGNSIFTGTTNFTGSSTHVGAVTMSTTLVVTGASTYIGTASFASAVNVTGNMTVAGTLNTTSAAVFVGTTSFTNGISVTGFGTFRTAFGVFGTTSGTVSIGVAPAAGTYNFMMPTSSGTPGQTFTSGGGGTAVSTWTSPIKIVGAVLSYSAGTPTTARTVGGNWINGIADNGTGDMTLTPAASTFLNAPICTCTVENAATVNPRTCKIFTVSTTGILIISNSGVTDADEIRHIVCIDGT